MQPNELTALYDLEETTKRQEARSNGPSLGEFYGQGWGLPGLRALWFPGLIDENGNISDRTGQGRTLTYNGNPALTLHNDRIPYMALDGTGDYHARASEAGLEITGTETTIASAYRGLTMGIWFRVTNLSGEQGLMTKRVNAGNLSYYLRKNGSNLADFEISSNGTAVFNVTSAGKPITVDDWHFAVARFTPSQELAVFLDGEKFVNTTSIPASIFVGNAQFSIGSTNGTIHYLVGGWAFAFLAPMAYPDVLIRYQFERSRVLFQEYA